MEPKPTATYVTSDHAVKAEKAWRARVAGATWRQAAQMSGYSDAQAAIKAVRTFYGTVPREEREELRRLWRDRLEVAWRQVQRDMADQRSGAVTASVRVATAAVALDGLAEPVRVDMTISDTFMALTRELEAEGL